MQCTDKQGHLFEVYKYDAEHYPALENMYATFYPKGKFQGMPPLKDEASHKWIKKLLASGKNFLAWQDGKTVGHVVLLPDFQKGDAEYLIFVSHPHRGRGIGSELTRLAIDHAKRLGLTLIWLIVGATNFRAIGLYKKFGFSFAHPDFVDSEHQMILRL